MWKKKKFEERGVWVYWEMQGLQEISRDVLGSCWDLSDWIQMWEVRFHDPGSTHWGPSLLTSSYMSFTTTRPHSDISSSCLPMLSLLLSFHHVYFNSFSQTHAEKRLPRASHTSVHSCTEAMAVSLIYNYLFRNIQCTLTFAIYSHETSGQHLPALLHLGPAYDLFFSFHLSHSNLLTLTHCYFMWQ